MKTPITTFTLCLFCCLKSFAGFPTLSGTNTFTGTNTFNAPIQAGAIGQLLDLNGSIAFDFNNRLVDDSGGFGHKSMDFQNRQMVGNWSILNGGFNGAGITNATSMGFTNVVSGQIYTNATGQTLEMTVPVLMNEPATTLGNAEVDAKISPQGGTLTSVSWADIAGGATSVITTNRDTLVFLIPSGWQWVVTNTISGTGYGVALSPAGTTNTATYLP